MKRLISLVLALSCLLTLTVPVSAADSATGTTLRLTETKGTVTVKTASGESKSIVKSMRLYNGYSVATGASSSAYIGLDDTKAVQLDSSGMVEIKKQGKKLEVSLTSGQLHFNVTEPLKTDESLNIRTATMVTGIRGSFGWVTSTEMGLMHGHVTLTCTNPETGETRVTEVYSGEKVTFESATQETAADPTRWESDFVKEEIVNADVPVIVVEAVKNDETLQRQLTEDVESIDVSTLIDSLETKQAEEKAAEEAAQAQVTTALAAQETAIAEEAAAEQASGTSGGTAQEYLHKTPEPVYDDSDDTPPAPATYTVSMPTGSYTIGVTPGAGITDNGGGTYTVDAGTSVPFTVNYGAGFTSGPDMVIAANGTPLTATASTDNTDSYTISSVSSSVTVTVSGTIYTVVAPTQIGGTDSANVLTGYGETGSYAVMADGTAAGAITVDSAAKLYVKKGALSSDFAINNSGTITVASGASLIIGYTSVSDGTVDNNGTVRLSGGNFQNNGIFSNSGTLTVDTTRMFINGMDTKAATYASGSSATTTLNGTFVTYEYSEAVVLPFSNTSRSVITFQTPATDPATNMPHDIGVWTGKSTASVTIPDTTPIYSSSGGTARTFGGWVDEGATYLAGSTINVTPGVDKTLTAAWS